MKKTKIICVALTVLAGMVTSCSEYDDVDDLSGFSIDLANAKEVDPVTGAYVFNLKDTIRFNIIDTRVDNINFYSGTLGEEYRYRNRWIADDSANITPQVKIKTAVNNLGDGTTPFRFDLGMAFDNDIPGYTDDSVAAAKWKFYKLRQSNTTSGDVVTEYFNFNDGMSTKNGTNDYTDWFSHQNVIYCIRAKSDSAARMNLELQDFYVSNKETRDYSYTYNGETLTNKKTKEYLIFHSCSIFDANLHVTNYDTGACWSMYTPKTTIKEGDSTEVANSQKYAWNTAEFGLKYGEYSGTNPWVKTNKFGMNIKTVYPLDITTVTKSSTDEDENVESAPADSVITTDPYESWIVSLRHNVHRVENDMPTTYVKTKVQSSVNGFYYTYLKDGKGLYTATFYVNNCNLKTSKEYVKEFKFLIK
jgi:hypothetical protein